jgi:hypothetical protein
MKSNRTYLLIGSTVLASWLGMQAVHEAGHVLGAKLTGGRVEHVDLHPLTISHTELAVNPSPLVVVWAGPVVGVLLPVTVWAVVAMFRFPSAFLFRFFAGFCLIANGAYIAGGSLGGIGDAGVMLRNGSPEWVLWAFGGVIVPAGLALWHRQSKYFGLGPRSEPVLPQHVAMTFSAAVLLIVIGLVMGGG